MATKILIPTPLRPFTDRKDAVEVDGKTVGELLADLINRHAGLKAHLYNAEGKLRSFVNIYVNDEDIRYLQKEATAVKSDDTISIIPSVAGGSPSTTDDATPTRQVRRSMIQWTTLPPELSFKALKQISPARQVPWCPAAHHRCVGTALSGPPAAEPLQAG